MDFLEEISNVDIYLLDQIVKGNIHENQRIIDAGCGAGRNLKLLMRHGFDVTGIDPNERNIVGLKENFPNNSDKFLVSTIENFEDKEGFDVVICNAVLHFAESPTNFVQMLDKLVSLLKPNGLLFIRMTSNIGLQESLANSKSGVHKLPDGSTRYVISRHDIDDMLNRYPISLAENVKTTNVDGLRCMTTLVFRAH